MSDAPWHDGSDGLGTGPLDHLPAPHPPDGTGSPWTEAQIAYAACPSRVLSDRINAAVDAVLASRPTQGSLVETLERRHVITTDPSEAMTCCGLDRDADGFCVYKPKHPIYVRALLAAAPAPTEGESPYLVPSDVARAALAGLPVTLYGRTYVAAEGEDGK